MLNTGRFLVPLSLAAGTNLAHPTLRAADALGYQVAGQFAFGLAETVPTARDTNEVLREIREICPRLAAPDTSISKAARIVVLAWPDPDLPKPMHTPRRPPAHLAWKRALATAKLLTDNFSAKLSFELVNMAVPKPHRIKVTRTARVNEPSYDVKRALRIAGTPQTQLSKAVIWVDCVETPGAPRSVTPTAMPLHAGTTHGSLIWATADGTGFSYFGKGVMVIPL
ncbi:MAG: hypothetical protein HC902_05810 [Calothrix sp. SM1_5_4]|nr:hypothetical protein [Calothrix sp. SM1_5_4]